jgi:hypothetical protein
VILGGFAEWWCRSGSVQSQVKDESHVLPEVLCFCWVSDDLTICEISICCGDRAVVCGVMRALHGAPLSQVLKGWLLDARACEQASTFEFILPA